MNTINYTYKIRKVVESLKLTKTDKFLNISGFLPGTAEIELKLFLNKAVSSGILQENPRTPLYVKLGPNAEDALKNRHLD